MPANAEAMLPRNPTTNPPSNVIDQTDWTRILIMLSLTVPCPVVLSGNVGTRDTAGLGTVDTTLKRAGNRRRTHMHVFVRLPLLQRTYACLHYTMDHREQLCDAGLVLYSVRRMFPSC